MSDQPPTTVRLPSRPSSLRIAIIGETLANLANPLEGAGAQMLANLLSAAGISPEQCLLAAVCPTSQPPETVKWASEPVQANLPVLRDHLAAWQPHFCILLGNLPLWAFLGRRGAGCSVDDRRGYLFESSFLGQPVRCLATYPPNRIFKEYGLTGIVKLDLRRALTEARAAAASQPLHLTESAVRHDLSKERILDWIAGIRANRTPVSLDIEGGVGFGPSCIGFAANRWQAIVVPFYDPDGRSLWSEEDEIELWEAVAGLLEDPAVPKCLQNALYEGFVLGWTLGIVIHGLRDDIMLKHFELYCELEKSLEFQASIYTRRPYWKIEHKRDPASSRYVPWIEGRRATASEWFTYNGLDCCITQEINEELEGKLAPKQREHYQLNVRLLQPVLYMMLRGLRYDRKLAKQMLADIQQQIYELQDQINREAAKSPSRAQLAAFYEAIDSLLVQTVASEHGRDAATTQPNVDARTQRLLPLLTAAFCPARLTEKRQVEEVSWQPMRWNGKRWVKAGKRVTTKDHPGVIWDTEEEPQNHGFKVLDDRDIWLKPVRKVVERSFPLTPTTLDVVFEHCKDSCQDACKRALKLVRQVCAGGGSASHAAACGELATLLDLHVKINATGRGNDKELEDGSVERGEERDANWFIYEHCGFPKQFKKEKGQLTNRLTTNDAALITIWIDTNRDPRVTTFMQLRSADTRREALQATVDSDGRIRCGYILPGTDTYRLSCSKSNTGSGYNLQTVTEDLRVLFPADEGCDFGQFDLRGADGWTIAAHAAAHGDPTMLEDLLAGIKPANIIALIYEHGEHINQLPRSELLTLQKTVPKESWIYVASKKVLYGSCYLMGERKQSETLVKDSYKETGIPVYVEPRKCKEMQEKALFLRYWGIRKWQEESGRKMMTEGCLTTSAGFKRLFYGRKKKAGTPYSNPKPDRETHGKWLGHEPQFNTTLATKLGLWRLWTDPENRRPEGSLHIEPLHTVHDSLNLQWPQAEREFAKRKVLPCWFNNPIMIAGQMVNIPVSGTYGPNWKDQEQAL